MLEIAEAQGLLKAEEITGFTRSTLRGWLNSKEGLENFSNKNSRKTLHLGKESSTSDLDDEIVDFIVFTRDLENAENT